MRERGEGTKPDISFCDEERGHGPWAKEGDSTPVEKKKGRKRHALIIEREKGGKQKALRLLAHRRRRGWPKRPFPVARV